MKKRFLLTLGLAALCLGTLASCGENKVSNVEAAIKDAESMTRDQLFKKAAEELGTTGVLKILATTSRGAKCKAEFIAELQKYNPSIKEDQFVYDTTVDGLVYKQLLAEITTGQQGYSGTVCQDGYQLQTKGIDTGYLLNYVPKEWKEDSSTDTSASNPLTLQYQLKTWMYNNKNGDMNIDNVWDFTDSSFKGRIDTMNPDNENVNMDWLIQLTEPTQLANLKAAYESSTNSSDVKSVMESTYGKYGDKKYAYAFIDRFLTNAVFYADDGKAMEHLAATPGNVGWIVYSKLLKVSESTDGSVSKKNIVVAAYGDVNTDGKTMGKSQIEGFGGFIYKHYLQLTSNSQYPYATCAFFNFISTTQTGYKGWIDDIGDYPTMTGINKDRSKNGYVDGVCQFKCLNDVSSDWWKNTAKCAVETPSYIGANYDTIIGFIDVVISKKK